MVANSIILLSLVLLVGFIATRLSKVLRLPHSVFLVLFGLIIGGILQVTQTVLPQFFYDSMADIILLILLPPLIFESAYNLKLNDLKKDLLPIISLATIGLCLSATMLGFTFQYLFNFALFPALVFGALISATDPVAVVALFREVGAPKRLITLVEGESLFNDGTALVLYNLFLAIALTTGTSEIGFSSGVLNFIKIVFGGIGVGLIMSVLTSFFLRLTDKSSSAQIGLTVSCAYLSFVVADHSFHVSGIFATLAVGLYLGHRARLELNKEALHGMHSVWSLLALCANSVVFLLLGVSVDYVILIDTLPLIPVAVLTIYLSRMISVPVSLLANNLLGTAKVNKKQQIVLMWGGLRGGLAIALVLLLPDTFPHKATFMALATAFVLATLLINALSVGKLMSWLKFDQLADSERSTLKNCLLKAKEKTFSGLKEASELGVLSPVVLEIHDKQLNQYISEAIGDAPNMSHFDLQNFLFKEQDLYNHFLEDREISKSAYQTLKHTVNERFYQHLNKQCSRTPYRALFLASEGRWWHLLWTLSPLLHRRLRFARLDKDLEILFFQFIAINQLIEKGSWEESTQKVTKHWRDDIFQQIHRLFLHYPKWAQNAQARFMTHMANAGLEHSFEKFLYLGIVNEAIYSKAMAFRANTKRRWLLDSKQDFNINISHLLMSVTPLKVLPQMRLKELEKASKLYYFEANSIWSIEAPLAGSRIYVLAEGEVIIANKKLELGPFDSIVIDATETQPRLSIESKGEITTLVFTETQFIVTSETEIVSVDLMLNPIQAQPNDLNKETG